MTALLGRYMKQASGLHARLNPTDRAIDTSENTDLDAKDIWGSYASNVPVMILGDHFGYPGNVVHGVTTYYLNIIPALVASGVSVHACFLREPHFAAQELRDKGIEPVFFSAGKWNPLVAFRLAAYMRRHNCKIVHACGIKASLIARIAARLVGSKVIVHVHDQLYPGFLVRAAHKLFARHSDAGVSVSGAATDVVVNGYHINPAHSRVIHNGLPLHTIRKVDPRARRRLRKELDIPASALVIAVVARMHPIKGHRSMLAIMARVVKERPDVVLLIAGDGPERPACEALAKQLGISASIRFLGTRNDVPDLMIASDLIAIPSKSEGLSMLAIEACAVGRPVIGFDAGGLCDVIDHGVTGYLVPPGDETGFANAILDLGSDPGKRNRFGEHGKKEAQRFTLDSHVRKLLICYLEVAGLTTTLLN